MSIHVPFRENMGHVDIFHHPSEIELRSKDWRSPD